MDSAKEESDTVPHPSPPSSLTLVDESVSLSIRCSRSGEDELLVAIGTSPSPVKVHESFLRATFKRAAGGANLRLLDQNGRVHHSISPSTSCKCHVPTEGGSFFELPRAGICYELLFDEKDSSERDTPKRKVPGEIILLSHTPPPLVTATAAAPAPLLRRLDLSGGEHGEGGHKMYIAPNGTRVVSSVPAAEGCGIANLFSQSKGKYYFMGAAAAGARSGHLTFEFPWPVRVARVVIRSRVPGLGFNGDQGGGGTGVNVLPHRCRSNYGVLLWGEEKGGTAAFRSWVEAVPLVDTADHPAPGIETAHELNGRESIDKLRIFMTSEGDDAGVALGSVAIYFSSPVTAK